jgi:hypothetical protein
LAVTCRVKLVAFWSMPRFWLPSAPTAQETPHDLMVSPFLMVAGVAVKRDLLASLVGPDADRGGARWCPDHRRWECTRQRSAGGECHKLAVRGLDRCDLHAGVPKVEAKAEGRAQVTLARIVAARPRRHPGEVILETLHAADVLFQQSMEEVEWSTATPEERALVIESIEMAQRFARTVIVTAAYERHVALQERIDQRRANLIKGGMSWYHERQIGVLADRLGMPADDVRAAIDVARDAFLPVMFRSLSQGHVPEIEPS